MTTAENKAAIRRLYEDILNNRAFMRLPEVISKDYSGVLGERGPSGFEATVRGLVDGFPDIQWRVENLIAEDEQVVVEWSWTGTHTGKFRVFEPSQKHVEDRAAVIYHFGDGGKIVKASIHSDRLGFLQQIGLIPEFVSPPPAAANNV